MFERLRRACVSSQSRNIALATLLTVAASATPVTAAPREGYSKVTIGNRYLFAQPNASAPPALSLIRDIDASIVEGYDDFMLTSVAAGVVETLRDRARAAGVEVTMRDDYDKIFVNGRAIDARLGTASSIGEHRPDPAYANDEWGAWIIQFSGPIRPHWIDQLRAEGVIPVQYLPYNAFIVGARESAIRRASLLRPVQFVEQLHSYMKPSFGIPAGQRRKLWIQMITAQGAESLIALLRRLSATEVETAPWSDVETRVEGTFSAEDVALIAREPLVIAIAERPAIAMSDERAVLSVTDLQPGTSPGRYKKWLADLCEACGGNLNAEGYSIGIADLGIDGGSHAASAQISGGTECKRQSSRRPAGRSDRLWQFVRGHFGNLGAWRRIYTRLDRHET